MSGIRALFAFLPAHAKNATGMSRHLGVVRNTCQRIVTALAEAEPTPMTLVRLPGVEGLGHFIRAVEASGADAADIAAADAATELFQTLLREVAGSQLRLADRLKALPAAAEITGMPRAEQNARSQQILYSASSHLAGQAAEVVLSISAYQRLNLNKTQLRERATLSGLVAHISRQDAAPLSYHWQTRTVSTGEPAGQYMLLDGKPLHGRTPDAIVRRFSSDPLPVATSRGEHGAARLVVDTAAHPHKPLDIFTECKWVDSISESDPQSQMLPRNVWSHMKVPARVLVMDVYLHRELAMFCAPDADVFMSMTTDDVRDRWMNRLPDAPKVQMLGRGIDRCSSQYFSQNPDVTRYMFERVGWDPRDFVGMRLEVEYPIWLAYYSIFFNPQYPSGQNADEAQPSIHT